MIENAKTSVFLAAGFRVKGRDYRVVDECSLRVK
jgi:hypothetical protein